MSPHFSDEDALIFKFVRWKNTAKTSKSGRSAIFRFVDFLIFRFFDFSAKFGRRTPDFISKSCSERPAGQESLIFTSERYQNTTKTSKNRFRRSSSFSRPGRHRSRVLVLRRRRRPVLWVTTISFVGDDNFICGRRRLSLWETTKDVFSAL